jgi:hypothetical protein
MASLSRSFSMPNITTVSSEKNQMVEWNLLRMERYRLKTFEKWPHSWLYLDSFVISELTRNGFYYTGVWLRIECVFCQGIFTRIPTCRINPLMVSVVHFGMRQRCPFARGHPCGNIPIDPGPWVIAAYDRMAAHLVEALEFEPYYMNFMRSAMPRGFDYWFHSDDSEDDF